MIKFTPGQIVYTRKTDDLVIVRFYEVIRATSSTCELREIRKNILTQNFNEQEVEPVPSEFVSPPFRRKISKLTGCIKMSKNLYAWPWEGDTLWQTITIFMP